MIYLIAPEHFYLFETLAVPQLTGFLKDKGYKVIQHVLDNYFYDNAINEHELCRAFDYVCREQANSLLSRQIYNQMHPFLLKSGLARVYGLKDDSSNFLKDMYRKRKAVSSGILKSKERLHRHFLNLGKYPFMYNAANLQFGLYLFTLRWYPSTFRLFEGYKGPISKTSSDRLIRGIKRDEVNYFNYYYKQYILHLLKSPQLVGISFTHQSQVVPGFTLASLVKQRFPDCHIVIGGALINHLKGTFAKINPLWSVIDSVGIGQGEKSLPLLIDAVAQNQDLGRIPNLIYRSGKRIISTPTDFEYDTDLLSVPEYSDKRPNPILPFIFSVGCDWGRCKFCHFPHSARGFSRKVSYKTRDKSSCVDQIATLNKRLRPSYFHLCDTMVSARFLEQLSDQLLARKVRGNYYCFVRAENKFLDFTLCEKMHRAGFFALHFGIETASQRLLNNMGKGISISSVEGVLRNFNKAGIMSNIFLITGLPGELQPDSDLTVDFIRRNRQYLDGEIVVQRFYLDKNSEIENEPESYGLHRVGSKIEDLAPFVDFEKINLDEVPATKQSETEMYKQLGIQASNGTRFLEMYLERKKTLKHCPQMILDMAKAWFYSRAISK